MSKSSSAKTDAGKDTATTEQATGTAAQAGQTAKNAGNRFVDKAKEQIAEQISSRKDQVTGTLDTTTEALKAAAQHLRDGGQEPIANWIETAITRLEPVTAYVRDVEFEKLYADVEAAARRYPALFVGGAFVAGMAAVRFLKSAPPSGDAANGGAKASSAPALKSTTPSQPRSTAKPPANEESSSRDYTSTFDEEDDVEDYTRAGAETV